jgi:pyruvate kinase
VEHIDEILEVADGIMIARGDLGVEVPIERIAVVQKDLMRRANRLARPVITATQMLESMTTHRLPTRAETTDVANAIFDGTDCVMLSAESATGSFPVEAVAMLARIAATAEPARRRVRVGELYQTASLPNQIRPEHLVALGVEACLEYITPAAVFVPTLSGATARRMALLRLPIWCVAVSSRLQTCQALQFSYGVVTVHQSEDPESWNDFVETWLVEHEIPGDLALLTGGPSPDRPQANHRLEIIEL